MSWQRRLELENDIEEGRKVVVSPTPVQNLAPKPTTFNFPRPTSSSSSSKQVVQFPCFTSAVKFHRPASSSSSSKQVVQFPCFSNAVKFSSSMSFSSSSKQVAFSSPVTEDTDKTLKIIPLDPPYKTLAEEDFEKQKKFLCKNPECPKTISFSGKKKYLNYCSKSCQYRTNNLRRGEMKFREEHVGERNKLELDIRNGRIRVLTPAHKTSDMRFL
jgi:hypothetical protein